MVENPDERVRNLGVRDYAPADQGWNCGGVLREMDGVISYRQDFGGCRPRAGAVPNHIRWYDCHLEGVK